MQVIIQLLYFNLYFMKLFTKISQLNFSMLKHFMIRFQHLLDQRLEDIYVQFMSQNLKWHLHILLFYQWLYLLHFLLFQCIKLTTSGFLWFLLTYFHLQVWSGLLQFWLCFKILVHQKIKDSLLVFIIYWQQLREWYQQG